MPEFTISAARLKPALATAMKLKHKLPGIHLALTDGELTISAATAEAIRRRCAVMPIRPEVTR